MQVFSSRRKDLESEEETHLSDPQPKHPSPTTNPSLIQNHNKHSKYHSSLHHQLPYYQVPSELQSFNIEERKFSANWQKLNELVTHWITFTLLQPKPIAEEGSLLLEDGLFIVLWVRIILTNPFINKQVVLRECYSCWRSKILKNQDHFEHFFKIRLDSRGNSHSNKKTSKIENKRKQISSPPKQYKS